MCGTLEGGQQVRNRVCGCALSFFQFNETLLIVCAAVKPHQNERSNVTQRFVTELLIKKQTKRYYLITVLLTYYLFIFSNSANVNGWLAD